MMTDQEYEELQQMVKDNLELTERNHKILRNLQRAMHRRMVMTVVYWIIILGAMLGIYYYLQPVVDVVVERYDALLTLPDKLKGFDILDSVSGE